MAAELRDSEAAFPSAARAGARAPGGGSLALRSIVAHVVPVLVALAAVGQAAWAVARGALENELGMRLASAAGAAGSGLPLDLLLALGPGDEGTRTYRHAEEELREALQAAEISRLAVFTPDGRAVVDTAGTPIGAPLADLARDRLELARLWRGHATASALLFRGADGRIYKSGYAPLREGDRVVAGILAEGNAAFFAVLGRLARRLFAVGLAGALALAAISVIAARTITRPVRRLAEAARRIAGGDLATPIEPQGGGEEVAGLSRSLEEMRRSLAARERQMQMMLSGIAHEVRNPLGGMALFTGLLRESLPAEGEPASHVRRVQQELSHLTRVVEDFLDYARAPRAERQEVSPADLAAEIAGLVEGEVSDRALRLAVDVAAGTLRAEPSMLRRALLNLVQNAVQASPRGGAVRLSFARQGSEARFTVEDEGPGVAEEKREAIFEPFFTTRQKGTGLGLAFVRKAAAAHGGAVQVDRSPLGGARFTLTFPG